MKSDQTAQRTASAPPLVCSHCGCVVLLGEPMYWTPERPGFLWHDECAQAVGVLPRTEAPKKAPRRRRRAGDGGRG